MLLYETRYLTFFAHLSFVGMSVGCYPTNEPISESERRAIESEVKAAVDSLARAWATLDAQAVARHYADTSLDTYDGERSSAPFDEWARNGYDHLSATEIGPFQDLRFDVVTLDPAKLVG